MALIIETGAIVDGANSYQTVADLRAYAGLRGESVPEADADCEVLLIKAMDAMQALPFKGERVSKDQPLPWPRKHVIVEGFPYPETELPRQLGQAQCALAIEAQTVDLLPTTPVNAKGPVTSERIEGAVTVTYANPTRPNSVPAVAKAQALLSVLLRQNGLFAIRA